MVVRAPHAVVEASYMGDMDAAFVHHLRAAARDAHPMKWADVLPLVLCGTGSEAMAVRDGLSTATIVIVDPRPFLHELDLSVLGTSGVPPVSCWYDVPGLAPLRRQVDRWLSEDLIARSGAGRVLDLLCGPMDLVDLGDEDAYATDYSLENILERLGKSTMKALRFAAKSTTLVAYEDDPATRMELEAGARAAAATLRYVSPRAWMARRRLELLAGRRLVFDRGQDDVVKLVAQLQRDGQARRDLYAPYLAMRGGRGYVTTADDRDELRLQIADVAAGWATDMLASRGLLAVGRTFALVLYNGKRLDYDTAVRLDRDSMLHHQAVARAFPGLVHP